ncbi:MAG: serine hydrolase [Planctomycetes bacterium]|nr:serine hydrolase [Planctomycetota bacterium]
MIGRSMPCAFVACLTVLSYVANAQQVTVDEAYVARVRAALAASVDRDHPAIALAVVHGGRVLLSEAVGVVDRKSRQPVDEHTRFPLSELTGGISGLVASRLHADGVLDITEPIDVSIRDESGDEHSVSLLDLLRGTERLKPFELYLRREALGDWPLSRIVEDHVIHDTHTYEHAPFAVLQYVAEQRTGKPWSQLVEEYLAEPLGLKSFVADARREVPAGAVQRYREGMFGLVAEPGAWTTVPAAAGAWISASELGALLVRHLAASQLPLDDSSSHDRISLLNGWDRDPGRGSHAVYANGPGVRAERVMFPACGLAWIYIGTSSLGEMPSALRDALESVLPNEDDDGDHWNSAVGLGGGMLRAKTPDDLVGRWDGVIRSNGESIPFAIDASRYGVQEIRIGEDLVTPPERPSNFDEFLYAVVSGPFSPVHPRAEFSFDIRLRLNSARDEFRGSVGLSNRPYCWMYFPLRLKRAE